MHVLPRVRELEHRFPDELVVIGVHAGKYSAERVTSRISSACERLGVEHAVVNDRQFRVWRDYAVQAWPTMALIDPSGYLVGVQPGEFPVDAIAQAIQAVIAEADAQGTLVRGPDPIARPRRAESGGALRFPTRVLPVDGGLLVSDTGNGRVLDLSVAADGSATIRRAFEGFAEPRGLAVLEGAAYVADRAAHTILRLDRRTGETTVVAGTGAIGEGRLAPGAATDTPLRSPWGLAPSPDGSLLIAMAGAHQLWRLRFPTGKLELVAGLGGEDLIDGPAAEALLAQPSGVSIGESVAFADPESSAIRLLDGDERVRTLVGTGLFDFGDRDGVGDQVLFQHAEDVAWHLGKLAVADTYNERIKVVDPGTRRAEPWPGDLGRQGALEEPGGVASQGARLWVADTGNHRIVFADEDGVAHELEVRE